MLTLPPLREGIRALLNDESDRLERHYPDLPDSPQECGTCGGSGSFLWWGRYKNPPEPDRVAEYECPCVDQWLMSRYFLYHGIETVYQRMGLDDLFGVEPGAMAQVAEYLKNFDRYKRSGIGLILHGGMGTGKSLLAAMVAKTVLSEGHDAHFTTFSNMLSELTAGWNDEDQREWFIRRIRNAGLLVVDDIGREHKQRRYVDGGLVDNTMALSESSVDELLRHRVAAAKPTLITTNLDLDMLEAHYGSNVVSLLRECSIDYRFEGSDFRERARTRRVDESIRGLTRPVVVG